MSDFLHRISSTVLYVLTLISFSLNAQTVDYGNNHNAGKYITLNGVMHYYEVYGQGEPLLLIHGNGTGISGWKAQIEYFSNKYKVFAVDCRGRGKSELGNDSLTYIQQAADMAEFIIKMGLESVMVVGKSDGGIIGILMSIYYPGHLKKMVAFSANLWPDSTALFQPVIEKQHKERMHAEERLLSKDTTQNWQLIVQRLRMMEFQPHISAAELKRIKIPVLVMSCDRDVIKEEHTFFIYKNIPNAHLCFVPGERHGIARENPELFNILVDKFISASFKNDIKRF